MMARIATSIVLDREKSRLVFRASGGSVDAGLPVWSGDGCRPVIVAEPKSR
jgi:hypothetical protein